MQETTLVLHDGCPRHHSGLAPLRISTPKLIRIDENCIINENFGCTITQQWQRI